MEHRITKLKFDNLQLGWQGINEFLYLHCHKITDRQGGFHGSEFVSYNNYVIMENAWVDPEFDFGRILGYSDKKWSGLVNNYVDLHYLDLMRAEITRRVASNARAYNYTYHFDNSHGSGKDCLVAITFTKRFTQDRPVLVFQIRTSEVTKRLLFDFLLVQRIGEYIYGHNDFEVHLFAPSFYITAESFVMYNNVKPIKPLLKRFNKKHKLELHKFQTKVLTKFDEYINHPDPLSIMFRVNRRSVMQIQKDKNGIPISGVKSMKAKELVLKPLNTNIPRDVNTMKDLRTHKRLKTKNDK